MASHVALLETPPRACLEVVDMEQASRGFTMGKSYSVWAVQRVSPIHVSTRWLSFALGSGGRMPKNSLGN